MLMWHPISLSLLPVFTLLFLPCFPCFPSSHSSPQPPRWYPIHHHRHPSLLLFPTTTRLPFNFIPPNQFRRSPIVDFRFYFAGQTKYSSVSHLLPVTMNNLLSDSFEIPRTQSSRGADIEIGGDLRNSGELGLENFSKKVQEVDKQYDKLNNLLRKL